MSALARSGLRLALGLGLALASTACRGDRAPREPSEAPAGGVDDWYTSDAATARLEHALVEVDLELERPWRDEPRCLPSWAEVCEPEVRDGPAPPPTTYPPASLLSAYADYLATSPPSPRRARRAIDYAELLMSEGSFDRARAPLREVVDSDKLDPRVRVRAGRLLVEAQVELWLDAEGEDRATAARQLRESLTRLASEKRVWKSDSAEASALRRLEIPLRIAIRWDLGIGAQRAGLAGDDGQLAVCVEELTQLHNTFPDGPRLDLVLGEAATCAEVGYLVLVALQLRHKLASRYPQSPLAPDALLWVADTYGDVLMFDEALSNYRKFWVLYPKDERAALARSQWVQLAITLAQPVAKTVADWRSGTPDERVLAAAIEFRAAQAKPGVDALLAYLAEYGDEGGPAREVAVHVARASEAMRRSCPDPTRATGLCTTRALDGRLGEVLTRKRSERREAERALTQARELMTESDWHSDPIAAAGAPLALEDMELRELDATVALLLGDLSAEEALGVQPPRTYEPSRTRLWLDERKLSVNEMIGAYERVGRNDRARVAAAAERTGQVYESDATLLARVEAELRSRDELELADELAALSEARLGQALDAYQRCVDAITHYGDDPSALLGPCKLGVGRLTGVHDLVDPLLEPASLSALGLGPN